MRIAVASQDTREVSAHLGHCTTFLVYEVQNLAITTKEVRQLSGEGGCQCRDGGIFSAIGDCDHVMSRGMGQGLFTSLQSHGINPVITREESADQAVALFLQGTLATTEEATCSCEH